MDAGIERLDRTTASGAPAVPSFGITSSQTSELQQATRSPAVSALLGSVEAGGQLGEEVLLGAVDLVIDAGDVACRGEQRGSQHLAGDAIVDGVEELLDRI